MNTLSKLALGLAFSGVMVFDPAVDAAAATNPPATFAGPRPVAKAPAKGPTNTPAVGSAAGSHKRLSSHQRPLPLTEPTPGRDLAPG